MRGNSRARCCGADSVRDQHCRDLKSSKILLTKEGVAKIGDVGLAKTMVSDYFSWETAVGTCASLPLVPSHLVPSQNRFLPYVLAHRVG